MPKFTDTITIRLKAGQGGPGSVAFHREKYIAKGGPDGGDGGDGGNIYFVADRSRTNLSSFFKDRLYAAKRGMHGEGRNKHGADGSDLILKVPPGTEIIREDTGELISDMVDEDVPVLIAKGGRGGKGNAFFKSSTMQIPRFAQPGEEGDAFSIVLNLKLIADVGIVGLPNAGKSTFLKAVTNAKPKIGSYPFTTLIPNIGVVKSPRGHEYKIADIPGIIEGAHQGSGLGLSFLRHIERVNCLLYFIDIESEDIEYTYKLLRSELSSYSEELLEKPFRVVLTKADLVPDKSFIQDMISDLSLENIIAISSLDGYNTDTVLKEIETMVTDEE
ncbi:MAG: GTPase ObgE [Spirochaetes bacterium]|jgi:GTP-binding protein|nr:GTPase ObgE [Spirochaetota bacterium]